MFTGDPDLLYSGVANLALRPLIGTRNVLLLDGPEHLRRRKLLLPPFHGERMQAYRSIMAEAARRELRGAGRWARPQPALRHMQAITFEVILRAVFGLDEAERLGPLATRLRAVLDWVQGPHAIVRFALRGPEGLIGYAPLRSAWSRRSTPTCSRRSRDGAQRRDLAAREDILSMLLLARDEHGRALEDRDVRDELLTLLTAGHETTAATLAWAIHFLARDLSAQERLAAGEAGFADAVVQETLRLRPPIALVARVLKAPLTVAGRALPAGAIRRAVAAADPPRPVASIRSRPVPSRPLPGASSRARTAGSRSVAACAAASAPPSRRWRRGSSSRRSSAASASVRPASPGGASGRRGIVLVPRRGGRVILEPR